MTSLSGNRIALRAGTLYPTKDQTHESRLRDAAFLTRAPARTSTAKLIINSLGIILLR
jgi:hypothetical protein